MYYDTLVSKIVFGMPVLLFLGGGFRVGPASARRGRGIRDGHGFTTQGIHRFQ
jgi:hypothetical protein